MQFNIAILQLYFERDCPWALPFSRCMPMNRTVAPKERDQRKGYSEKREGMDWNDLKLIMAIARTGSLTGAARELSINHSTVFRRINTIEKSMGVRFFERIAQGYVMTEAGEAALQVAEHIESDVMGLTRKIAGSDLRLQGLIKVTAPQGLSLLLLGPLLAQFGKQHPEIEIQLIATSTTLELAKREVDLAIRVTKTPPDTSIGRFVCQFNSCIYASRRYWKTHQTQKLDECPWLITDDQMEWLPKSIIKKKRNTFRPVFSSNSVLAVREGVKQGLGLATLPCFIGDKEKSLVRVGNPLKELESQLWVLTHSDLRNTVRVRTLFTYLYNQLLQCKAMFEG